MKNDTILVIGAGGQIGTALLPKLREVYGSSNVIAADLKEPSGETPMFEKLDAGDRDSLNKVISKYEITQIYHLAAVLSAKAESDPLRAWNINTGTVLNVLEAARQLKLDKLFIPSSIAVFGPGAPRVNTPQFTYLEPSSVYGVSKVATENWCSYYHSRYGLDVRSLRYPGVISYQSLPGGGTTDYAVEMYHKAAAEEKYTCFLRDDTALPMIYIEDALRATLELMEAEASKITVRTSYNLAGLTFTPRELLEAIQTFFPSFECDFVPDFRQAIADSWPASIDDSPARNDWGWKPEYSLSRITEDMVSRLSAHYQH